jgi:hypothetical protein
LKVAPATWFLLYNTATSPNKSSFSTLSVRTN